MRVWTVTVSHGRYGSKCVAALDHPPRPEELQSILDAHDGRLHQAVVDGPLLVTEDVRV